MGGRIAGGGAARGPIRIALLLALTALGLGMLSGKALAGTGYEVCTIAEACKDADEGELGGEFRFPSGVATGPGGLVYVADFANHRIQVFDSNGNFVRAWGKDVVAGGSTGFEVCTVAASCKMGALGGLGGEFVLPGRVAVSSTTGEVFVADRGNNRVQVFDSLGNFIRTWGWNVSSAGGSEFEICSEAAACTTGISGEEAGAFDGPGGLAVAPTGDIVVSDILNNRIQVFASTGAFKSAWGKDVITGGGTNYEVCVVALECKTGVASIRGGDLDEALGVAIHPAGNVYVADTLNQRVQRYQADGTWLAAWGGDVDSGEGIGYEVCTVAINCQPGEEGDLGGELNDPAGIAVSPGGGIVYVADTENTRGQIFNPVGEFAAAVGKDVESGGGTGVEICEAALICKKGEFGSLGGESASPFDVATDSTGNIYVADAGNNRIQKGNNATPFLLNWGKDVINDGVVPPPGPGPGPGPTPTPTPPVQRVKAPQPAFAQDRQRRPGQRQGADQSARRRLPRARSRRADPGRVDRRRPLGAGAADLATGKGGRPDRRVLRRHLQDSAAGRRQAADRAEAVQLAQGQRPPADRRPRSAGAARRTGSGAAARATTRPWASTARQRSAGRFG